MAGMTMRNEGRSAARYFVLQTAIFVACAVGGTAASTALRLLVVEPAPDTTFDLWWNLTLGQSIFLVVLGLPLALIGVFVAMRIHDRIANRRLTLLAIEVIAGVAYVVYIVSGSVGYVSPATLGLSLLPWVAFGFVARVR
ncbi:MAG TPA: hypothetical protein VJ850_08200 [Candidatus Limnocylindrales bacterium]|nr:hypothetical protein [Candidatus Limnocylindrales bacterium]